MLLPLSVFFFSRVPKQMAAAQVLAENAFFLTANERLTFTDIKSTGERGNKKQKYCVRPTNLLVLFKDQQLLLAEANVVERVNNFDAHNVQMSNVDADLLSMLLSASSSMQSCTGTVRLFHNC